MDGTIVMDNEVGSGVFVVGLVLGLDVGSVVVGLIVGSAVLGLDGCVGLRVGLNVGSNVGDKEYGQLPIHWKLLALLVWMVNELQLCVSSEHVTIQAAFFGH